MAREKIESDNNLYSRKIAEAYNSFKKKEYSNCICLLNKAIEIDCNKYEAFYYLGIVYSKQKEYKVAVECFEQALKRENKELKIYQKIVKNLRFFDINSAILFAEKTLQIYQDYVLCTMLATLYSNLNNDFEAEKYYFKSLELNPNYLLTYCELISHYRKKNKVKEAVFYCEKLVEIEPKNSMFILQLCLLYLEIGEEIKALQLLDYYVETNHLSLSEIEKVAILYEKMQKEDKAIKYFSEAINLKTKNLEIYEKYLLCLEKENPEINKKNLPLLLYICEKAFLNSNPDINFMIGTAMLYLYCGRYKEAKELYLKVISIDEQNEMAKNGLNEIKKLL